MVSTLAYSLSLENQRENHLKKSGTRSGKNYYVGSNTYYLKGERNSPRSCDTFYTYLYHELLPFIEWIVIGHRKLDDPILVRPKEI